MRAEGFEVLSASASEPKQTIGYNGISPGPRLRMKGGGEVLAFSRLSAIIEEQGEPS